MSNEGGEKQKSIEQATRDRFMALSPEAKATVRAAMGVPTADDFLARETISNLMHNAKFEKERAALLAALEAAEAAG